ncbi:NB-ARC domain-containing protein [Streptomyces sp. NPDC041068]|uniref:ATP-binding protein n=1 Tax=Streptomyces sp. NPDC041068 TaxID=3155130 RepID=UPI0033C61AB1
MHLPSETTSFIGRTVELRSVEALLASDRLVTLTGVGGVGKSRLALRAARRVAEAFPHGVHLVQLSPLREPSLLGNVLLEELGLVDQAAGPAEELVAQWLVDKRLLLVLDSCEHLVAACARVARTLLDTAPELRVLVTSRQPLGIAGERCYEVEPLPVAPPTAEAYTGTGHGDALALFADRAAASAPDFTLDGSRWASAAAVCHRLDGIPLAIELAAAQLSDHTIEQLDDRLQHRFEALIAQDGTHGNGTAPPRHRTLRTTIGWSHELCEPLERLLWARLSVFVGGFEAHGARAVGAGGPLPADEVERLLEGLVAKSLVRRRTDGSGPVRFSMLDTVREFGAQWLRELGEEDVARRRHRDFHRELVLRAEAEWLGPRQIAWYTRLSADHANLRTALEFSLSHGEGRTAQEMGGALWFFWFACGFAREGRHYLTRALDLYHEPGPVRAKAQWACGLAAIGQGDLDAVRRLAHALRKTVGGADAPGAHAATYLEVAALSLRGDQERAAVVLDSTPELPHPRGGFPEAWLLLEVTRSFVHAHRGNFTAAADNADELYARTERLGERWMRAWVGYTQALASAGLGRHSEAAAHARVALEGKALLHDSLGAVLAVDLLASTAVAAARGRHAARLLGIGQRMWQAIGPAQMGMPELLAARAESERAIRTSIGDTAYEEEYGTGLRTSTSDGLAYALSSEDCTSEDCTSEDCTSEDHPSEDHPSEDHPSEDHPSEDHASEDHAG